MNFNHTKIFHGVLFLMALLLTACGGGGGGGNSGFGSQGTTGTAAQYFSSFSSKAVGTTWTWSETTTSSITWIPNSNSTTVTAITGSSGGVVTTSETSGGVTTASTDNIDATGAWVSTDSTGNTTVLLPANFSVGTTYVMEPATATSGATNATIAAFNVTRTVPAGTFTDCIQIDVASTFSSGGITYTATGSFYVSPTTGNLVETTFTMILSGTTSGSLTLTSQLQTIGSGTSTATPTITGFTPTSGAAGSSVTITGTNFSATAASNTVNFNGVSATVTSATATQLVATVPAAATSGTITVTTGGGTATSATSFTVTNTTSGTVILTPDVSTTGTVASGALSKYSVAVTSGTQYVASLTGIVGNADLRVYTDNTFATLDTCAAANTVQSGAAPEDCIVTASGNTLYLAAYGAAAGSNSYRVRVSPKNNATALSEGTTANPVTLYPNVVYQGSISPAYSAYSYYKVSSASGSTISINMTGMQGTQSLDLRVYNSSTGGSQTCTYSGVNGLLPEECVLAGGTPYDITIINYAAGVGGPFTLMVDSPNDPANGITAGTTSALAMNVSDWLTVNAGVLNKYSVPVTSGIPYVASLYGITGDVDLRVYTDSTYTTLASCAAANVNAVKTGLEDCIVTPTGSTLYLAAYGFGAGTNNYRIRVAPQSTGALVNQGTSTSPILLTPGTSYAGTIAPPYSSYSYYRVTTTGTATTSINMTGMSGAENIDVRVYAVPGGAYQSCNNGRTGVLPEECILPSGTWDITVINYGAGVGGTYLITAD